MYDPSEWKGYPTYGLGGQEVFPLRPDDRCVENGSTRGHRDEISRDIAMYDALYTTNTAISRTALKAPGIADWQIKIMCESPAGKRESLVLGCFWPGE